MRLIIGIVSLMTLILITTILYGGPSGPPRDSNIEIYDSGGNPIGSHIEPDGVHYSLNTHDADVHDQLFFHYLVYEVVASGTTLTAQGTMGDTTISVVDGSGFVAGDIIDILQGTQHIHLYRTVISSVANVITLDAPLPITIANGSGVEEELRNMNVTGSLAAPLIYTFYIEEGEILHLTNLNFTIVSPADGDDTKFGGIAALTNGVYCRVNRGNGTSYEDMFVWKSNSDIKDSTFQAEYSSKAGGGNYGFNGRWNSKENQRAIVRLDGSNGDRLEVLVQDDLSSLIHLRMIVSGHFESEL